MSDDRFDDVTFTITCTMRRRWAEQFLGMLKWFERLGGVGASREVTFFADGDGDFRPVFALPNGIDVATPRVDDPENFNAKPFDAG